MIDIYKDREEIVNVTFPQNKIVLLNGKELECYPKVKEASANDNDTLRLDNTGEYLSLHTPTKEELEKLKKQKDDADQAFFMDHAYFFYNHANAIFSDSRMFLAPVTASNGLAYTGTSGLRNATLGVYLEWWIYGDGYNLKDREGNDAITCILSGSPLSGANSCYGVYPDGTKKTIHHSSFGYLWTTFMAVNGRYSEAKQCYESYTLRQVYDMLMALGQSEESMLRMKLLISEGNAASLASELSTQKERYADLSKKYKEVCIENRRRELTEFSEEYNKRAEQVKKDVEEQNEQRRALKARLKSGEITNIEYQRLLHPIKERISEVKWSLQSFWDKGTKELVDDHLTLSMIDDFLWEHASDAAKESLRFV